MQENSSGAECLKRKKICHSLLALHFQVVVLQWRQRNAEQSVIQVQSCCFALSVKLLLFLISCPALPHLKLPIIYDTLWSVRNRIFSVQIELLLLIASETFFDSIISSSFVWLGKLGERTALLWRDNSSSSRRVRTHEKNSGETVRRLGTMIQSIFFVPNQ